MVLYCTNVDNYKLFFLALVVFVAYRNGATQSKNDYFCGIRLYFQCLAFSITFAPCIPTYASLCKCCLHQEVENAEHYLEQLIHIQMKMF